MPTPVLSRLCLVLAGLASSAACAATVYDNGAPDRSWGTQMSEFQVADDFQLAAGQDISSITFWSLQASAADYSGQLTWGIYSDAGGSPGSLLQGSTLSLAGVATGQSSGFGYQEYRFDIGVSFSLAAGHYWLALHNGPAGLTTPTDMLWGTSGSAGAGGVYHDGSGWWGSGNEQAFLLGGSPTPAVPEPASGLLFAAGLAAVGGLRRRATLRT